MFSHSPQFSKISRFALLAMFLTLAVDTHAAPAKKKRSNSNHASTATATATEAPSSGRKVKSQGKSLIQVVINAADPELKNQIEEQLPELVLFKNALVASTYPYVNRVSQFTGTQPWSNGIYNEKEDWRWSSALHGHPSVFDFFYQEGYFTAIVGSKLMGAEDKDSGINWDQEIGAPINEDSMVDFVEKFLQEPKTSPYFLTVVLNDKSKAFQNVEKLLQICKGEKEVALFITGGERGGNERNHEKSFEQILGYWTPLLKNGEDKSQLASSLDWYSTLCDWASLKEPKRVEGKSLLRASGSGAKTVVSLIDGKDDPTFHVRTADQVFVGKASDLKVFMLDDTEAWSPQDNAGEVRKSIVAALPREWAKTRRSKDEIKWEGLTDGSVIYYFEAGDRLLSEDGPEVKERGIEVQMQFPFDPKVHSEAVLLSHGTAELGFVVHLVKGCPAVTIRYEGLQSTLKAKKSLTAGKVTLRMVLGVDGSLTIGNLREGEVTRGFTPFDGGFLKNLEGSLLVGQIGEVLPKGKFPQASPFHGKFHEAIYSVLPGVREELRAAKAVPVE